MWSFMITCVPCRANLGMGKGMTIFPEELIQPLSLHARECAPNECCGFVFKHNDGPWFILSSKNCAPNPEHEFAINWIVWLKAQILPWVKLLGIYHSHPLGPRFLSGKDKELQLLTKLDMILIDLYNNEIRWYQHTKRGPRVTAVTTF